MSIVDPLTPVRLFFSENVEFKYRLVGVLFEWPLNALSYFHIDAISGLLYFGNVDLSSL